MCWWLIQQIWDKIGGVHVHDCLSKVLNVASCQAHSPQLKVGHEVRMSVGRLHPIQNLISRGIRQSKGLPLTGGALLPSTSSSLPTAPSLLLRFSKGRGCMSRDTHSSANLTISSIFSPDTSRFFVQSRLFSPPLRLRTLALNALWLSWQFLGEPWGIWIGLLQLGSNIHLSHVNNAVIQLEAVRLMIPRRLLTTEYNSPDPRFCLWPVFPLTKFSWSEQWWLLRSVCSACVVHICWIPARLHYTWQRPRMWMGSLSRAPMTAILANWWLRFK